MVFKPTTKANLQTAINGWTANPPTITASSTLDSVFGNGAAQSSDGLGNDSIGNMFTWDVSLIDDFSNLFKDNTAFKGTENERISGWGDKVSQVTTIESMFEGCTNFEPDPGFNYFESWNMPNLTTVKNAFKGAVKFNDKVDAFLKFGNAVTDMEGFLHGATLWNNGYSQPDEESPMSAADDEYHQLNWYTNKVITMKNLLRGSAFNQGIRIDQASGTVDRFNTHLVQSFEGTFAELGGFNQILGFLNTSSALTMKEMFKDSPKFNDGEFLGIGCWNVLLVTDFTSMFEGATDFRGKVHSWDLNANATSANGSFVDMFKDSGLAGLNAGIDLFQQKFTQTPSEDMFGYTFLEKTANMVTWASSGEPTGEYNKAMRGSNFEMRKKFGLNSSYTGEIPEPYITAGSGNPIFRLDAPYNIAFYLRGDPNLADTDGNYQYLNYEGSTPSMFAAFSVFVLGQRTGEKAFGMTVFDNDFLTRNTDSATGTINATNNEIEEANKKLIFELVKFIDLDNPVNQRNFVNRRIVYYEQGIFNIRDKTDPTFISYIMLEKLGDDYVWTDYKVKQADDEIIATGLEFYMAISQDSTFQPTVPTTVNDVALCNVPHKFSAAVLSGLLTTDFGAWFIQNYQTVPEYQAVFVANGSSFSNQTVVEYILTLLDRHVVNIDGADKLVDTNFKIYDMTGADLNQSYSEPFYGSNMVDDYKKPLDKIRLIANIDFSPQTVGIYSVYVPFCEKNSDGDNVKNYRKHYPSDLQQLYTSYFSDAGSLCESFACGSPNDGFVGNTSQAAEDDADYFFTVLAGVFAGLNKNVVLIQGFQDLRLVYFERGYHNPLNGYEGQVGTNTQPYISYVHFIDGQLNIVKKQTTVSSDGTKTNELLGLYAFAKQVPLTSLLREYTTTTASNTGDVEVKNRSFDQGKTNTMLSTMVNDWYIKQAQSNILEANKLYGPPKYWITIYVSTAASVFENKTGDMHPEIDYWNVKNFRSIKNMFKSSTFNGRLANWQRFFPEIGDDASTLENVTDMEGTFFGTTEFNDDIGGWIPDAAVTMKDMFKDAAKFDQSTLCKWQPADENIVLENMFGYTTTETPMFKNGDSYGFTVATPLYEEFGNCPPKFLSTPVTTAKEGEDYSYSMEVEDLDPNSVVTVVATKKPDWLSFEKAPANKVKYVLSGRPTSDNVGSHDIVLTATDNGTSTNSNTKSTTQSFTIVVTSDNNAPVFTSTPVTTGKEGVAYSYTVTASDPDGDSVTISATTIPTSWLSFTNNVLSGTPGSSDVGSHDVVLTATDSRDATTTQSFTIVVSERDNNAPTFTTEPVTTGKEGVLYSYSVEATDPDGDSVTIAATTIPTSWLSFTNNVLSGTPGSSDVGSHDVVLTATDSRGAKATQEFTIVVSDRDNKAPTFTSTPVTTGKEGVAYSYTVTASDPDGDSVTISATTIPTSWLSFTNNVLSGTPGSSDVGSHDVVLTATDSRGAKATQSFTIVVSERDNNAPTFTSTPVTTARQDSLYSYDVTTSDEDNGDVVTVTATTKPSWLSFNGSTLSGRPSRGIWGEYKVVLTATDSKNATATQSFTIMVRKPICFNEGTKILCFKDGKEQYVAVEQLREGDEVKTMNHGYKKIADMRKGSFKLNGLMDIGMYRMKKQGEMIADLEMSGLHCVLVNANDSKYADDIKRQRGKNNKKFYIDGKFRLRANQSHEFQQMEQKEYTIYSFALEQQKQYGVWANGVLVETTSAKNLEISNMERVKALVKGKHQ